MKKTKMKIMMMILLLNKIQRKKSQRKSKPLKSMMTSKMKLREKMKKLMSINLPSTKPGWMVFQSIIPSIPTTKTSRLTLRSFLALIRFLKKNIQSGAKMCLKHSLSLPKLYPK